MQLPFIPEDQSRENRTFAGFPDLRKYHWQTFYQYPHDYETFFNDHFGFRNRLTRQNSIFHFRTLKVLTNPNVVLGKKGWLFENNSALGGGLTDFEGKIPFSSSELRTIKKNLLGLSHRFREQGILFFLVITPSKDAIYPELLPDHFVPGRSRYAQIMELCRNDHLDFVIGLKDRLLKAKTDGLYPLYYLTDLHWNNLGMYFGYQEIMGRLRRSFPSLPVLRLGQPEFQFEMVKEPQQKMTDPGDLANQINLPGYFQEIIVLPKWLGLAHPKEIKPDRPLPAEGRLQSLYIQSRPDLPRLVMVHDSFGVSMLPLLAESFSRSYFLWMNSFDSKLIEPEKPQVVIWEMMERYSYTLLTAK